jgi:outer membrane receptor protein involved in Fe transport
MYTDGYELSITGNPTKNWRLVANYSYTEGVEENIIKEVLPWWAEKRAFYTSSRFPQDLQGTFQGRTIADEIAVEDDYIATRRSVEGVGLIGNRKHKFNVFTRYTFAGGFLKGAYVGGGYRYQGKMLVGRAPDDSLQYTAPVGEAMFLAGYEIRWKDRRRLNLQLNISNLFDETDPIITRYSTNSINLHQPRQLQFRVPRTARLTATFSF